MEGHRKKNSRPLEGTNQKMCAESAHPKRYIVSVVLDGVRLLVRMYHRSELVLPLKGGCVANQAVPKEITGVRRTFWLNEQTELLDETQLLDRQRLCY